MLTAEEMIKREIEKWDLINQKNQSKPREVTESMIQSKKRKIDNYRMFVMHSFLLKVLPSIENFQPKSKNEKFTQLEHFFILLSENAEAKKLFNELWDKADPKNLSHVLE